MHQMVHMQWCEPQGGWCWRETGSRAGPLLRVCCRLPLLGLKVLTEVEDPRREEEEESRACYYMSRILGTRVLEANGLILAGALYSTYYPSG